jgi:hypothetical protein
MKALAPVSDLPWKEELYTPPSGPSSSSSNGTTRGTSTSPSSTIATAPEGVVSVEELDAQLNAEVVASCSTCRNHPRTVALGDRWLARNLDGSLDLDLKSLHKIARNIHHYTPSIDTLRRHFESCRSEDYARLKVL